MRQLFWTILWVDLETERERETVGRQFVVLRLDCFVGRTEGFLSGGLECWASLRSHISSFITSNTKMKVAGIGRAGGGSYDADITSHPSKYSSPLQPLHQCPSQAGLRQQIFLCETNVYRGDGRLSLYCASIHEWVLSGILRRLCPYKLTQGL